MTQPIIVTDVPPPLDVPLPEAGDLVLYPEDVHDGRGIYPLVVGDIADELEADGLAVNFLYEDEQVEYYGDREAVVLAIVIGIVSSAAWDGIKRLLAKREGKQVKVTIGYRESGAVKWARAEGDAAAVAEALTQLIPRP